MWHVLYEERNYIVAGVRLRRNFANSSTARESVALQPEPMSADYLQYAGVTRGNDHE